MVSVQSPAFMSCVILGKLISLLLFPDFYSSYIVRLLRELEIVVNWEI